MKNEIRGNRIELILFVVFEIFFLFFITQKDLNIVILWIAATVLFVSLMLRSSIRLSHAWDIVNQKERAFADEKEFRRQAEGKAEDCENKWQAVLESAMDGILLLDGTGKIIAWNRSAEKMLGYSDDEFTTLVWDHTFFASAASDSSEVILENKNLLNGYAKGPDKPVEMRAIRKNQTEMTVEIRTAAFRLNRQDFEIRTLKDLTLRNQAREKLIEFSVTDSLTKLINRRHFFQIAAREYQRAARYEHSLSMAVINIDDLRGINRTWGMRIGDLILITLAEVVRYHIREIDVAARTGDGEISILMPSTDIRNASVAAERFRKISEETLVPVKETTISFTVSVGVSTVSDRTPSMEVFFQHAEEALYFAKEWGKNRVEICEESGGEGDADRKSFSGQ